MILTSIWTAKVSHPRTLDIVKQKRLKEMPYRYAQLAPSDVSLAARPAHTPEAILDIENTAQFSQPAA